MSASDKNVVHYKPSKARQAKAKSMQQDGHIFIILSSRKLITYSKNN